MFNSTQTDCKNQADCAHTEHGQREPLTADKDTALSPRQVLECPPATATAVRKPRTRHFDRDKWLAKDAERRERARPWYAGQPPLERPHDRPGNDALQFVNDVLGRLRRRP
jgi:hypothetical protein